MNQTLTQEKLEEMVVGKSANPRAIFFEHAKLNVPKSKAANHRVYDKLIYIKLTQPGVADSVSYEATKVDFKAYPEEYEYFLQNKQGERAPGVDIIPNLDIAHLQELRDMGLLTIPKLAEMEDVPPHLAYAHRAAKVFNQALQETSNGYKENEQKEVRQIQNTGGSEEVLFVPAADRREHRDDVGRREVPESTEHLEDLRSSEGDDENRRPQRGYNGVNWGNWSVKINV